MKGDCQLGERCASGRGFLVDDTFKRCKCGPEALSIWDGLLVLKVLRCCQCSLLLEVKRPSSPFVEELFL